MSLPIEDFATIGADETAALMTRSCSVCWPRFDSDACFAALLGSHEHGRWGLPPVGDAATVARRYDTDTLVLEADFRTASGDLRLIDCMPVGAMSSSLVRIVVGLHGRVDMRWELALRFDYGGLPPWVMVEGACVQAEIGPDQVMFRCIAAVFLVDAGQRLAFTLSYGTFDTGTPPPIDAEAALSATETYWRNWIGRFDKPTKWPEAVRRSLIVLEAPR